MRLALEDEEKKNQKLRKEVDTVTQKSSQLASSLNVLEEQIERERVAQRNFNLAERTERIQNHYSNLRSTMTNYYDQISSALPLLMLLSQSQGNTSLGDIIPILAATMGEFNNGENVPYSYRSCSLS